MRVNAISDRGQSRLGSLLLSAVADNALRTRFTHSWNPTYRYLARASPLATGGILRGIVTSYEMYITLRC